MKITRLITSTVAAATVACLAISQSTATAAEAKKKVIIGFIAKSLSNDVFQAAQAGAADAAKELGAKYNVDVELEIRTPNDEDATKQAEAVEALTRRGRPRHRGFLLGSKHGDPLDRQGGCKGRERDVF